MPSQVPKHSLRRLIPAVSSFDWADPRWTLRTLAQALGTYARAWATHGDAVRQPDQISDSRLREM
ncbi:hypothetical protein WI23_26745 [Burkholderia oklahomensis C6786]|nr:hypothetical protein WI23_26745 [Burkholderia oklahomensis C6786]